MTGYNYTIIVPPGKTLKEPMIVTKGVKPGTIENIHIEFPNGCNRFVYVKVWMGETPLIPDDKGEWLRGNGHLYPYIMDFEVKAMQGTLKIILASPDATLPHLINVGLGHSAIPKPDTLTPAIYDLKRSVDVLISVTRQKGDDQTSLLTKLTGGLLGGIRRH